jgi:hypothetical protein
MAMSEDEEEVREDLPLDNEENDEFYEHLLMQELEAEDQVRLLFILAVPCSRQRAIEEENEKEVLRLCG